MQSLGLDNHLVHPDIRGDANRVAALNPDCLRRGCAGGRHPGGTIEGLPGRREVPVARGGGAVIAVRRCGIDDQSGERARFAVGVGGREVDGLGGAVRRADGKDAVHKGDRVAAKEGVASAAAQRDRRGAVRRYRVVELVLRRDREGKGHGGILR